jgi:3-hydroxyacyl-CoA dehydrogenase
MTGEHRPSEVDRVAVAGAGLIGAGWTTVFLAAGLQVTVSDPAPGAEERLTADVARRWSAVQRLGLTDLAEPPELDFTPDLEAAVAEADWIQESVPDDEDLKAAVVRRIDAVAGSHAVIASSTSGILPSTLQGSCGANPGRVIVGHPFNPVHILPLVEVVGGRSTSDDVIRRALAFYRAIGKRPLHVRVEAPGFVSNRLQEAINREVFHLVDQGVATCEEVDAAIVDGPGLRFAIHGPSCVYMLQGGSGGVAHALSQFSPERIADWSYNYYPDMTPDLIATFDGQTREMSRGRCVEEWEAERDEFLVRVLQIREQLMQETRGSERSEERDCAEG